VRFCEVLFLAVAQSVYNNKQYDNMVGYNIKFIIEKQLNNILKADINNFAGK
jgi:hypothetical protein